LFIGFTTLNLNFSRNCLKNDDMDELAGLTRLYGISCFFYPRRAFECLFNFLYRLLIFLSFCFKNVKFGRLYL